MYRKTWKENEWQIVKVIKSELVDYGFNKLAVKLTLVNEEMGRGNFLIFANNTILINELIEITYGYYKQHDVDEEDFIGLEMFVWLEERNGYLNITNLASVN